jgi:hypothetical protein
MRFLFTTLQTFESEFYGRVGAELVRRGHEVSHLTVSHEAARRLTAEGFEARSVHDVIARLGEPESLADEVRRIEETYPIPHLRDVYYADRAALRLSEDENVHRAVQTIRAVERVVSDVAPDVLVPEVGNETIRVANHLVGVARGIPVLFLLYTLFPNPLRLTVDTLHAPIVAQEELTEPTAEEREAVEAFRRSFTERAEPIRPYRAWRIETRRARLFADHVRRKRGEDRDNEYLEPWRLLWQNVAETARARAARPFYDRLDPARPFVYFPLHVTDDYKIKKVIPHCVDQASILEQVADALPQGYDLVLKEHPMSVGRNSFRLLRRLRERRNVRLVEPHTSSHELIRSAEAIAVISSTVGIEALLYGKPVLTLGQPFYAGYGVTIDVSSFAEIRGRIPELLRFRPDPELIVRFLAAAMRVTLPGAPVLVDRSPENAVVLAGSIEQVASQAVEARRGVPA